MELRIKKFAHYMCPNCVKHLKKTVEKKKEDKLIFFQRKDCSDAKYFMNAKS